LDIDILHQAAKVIKKLQNAKITWKPGKDQGHLKKRKELVERFKSSFQISKSNWLFEKDVAT